MYVMHVFGNKTMDLIISYLQWQHEVKVLSFAAFCRKGAALSFVVVKMPSFSCMYTHCQ